jgi:plastocyanin
VHALALQLALVLAAEKSKTPFYIAGGVLVVWALLVSLVLGMNRPNFPFSLRGQRAVMAISAVLVLATLAAAIATASTPGKESASSTTATQSAASEPAPSSEQPASGGGASTSANTQTATTATPTGGTSASGTATSAAPAAGANSAAGNSVSLAANPAGLLSYNTKTLSAKSGSVTVDFTNSSPVEHNVTIAQGGKVLGATPTFSGGEKKLTLALKPGKYVFYCSVPGHRQAGMEGTLNVS